MAQCSIRAWQDLDAGCILAPERYDPRRTPARLTTQTLALRQLVSIARRTVSPKAQVLTPSHFVLLDASDAKDGIADQKSALLPQASLGSTKKIAPMGSVIISRLRPYLRQVAFLDAGVMHASMPQDVQIACSTEFFILVSQDDACLAFLVPWLLSAPVQGVLAAAQEGGHHPRFDEQTLLEIPVPKSWVRKRASISSQVLSAIAQIRRGRDLLAHLEKNDLGT